MLIGLSIACIVTILDQLSKYLVLNYVLGTYNYIKVWPFFNVVNAWNTGVSFSMFSSNGNAGTIVLSIVALLIIAMMLWWLKNEKSLPTKIALGMIIGGALGNVIDRLRFGAVFDFLDFYIIDYHWPAFNLADSMICIGAAIILIDGICNAKKGENKQ